MTSTAQPVPNPVHAQSASPSAASGTTSNQRSSYASAAATKGKPAASTPTIVGNPSAAAGPPAPNHHANASPVNGRPSAPPAIPSVPSGPTIVNSSVITPNGTNDHTRKPSVTISAQGAGYLPNGTPSGPAGRPQLQFGSINASSPSMANSVPHMPHASLGTNLNTPGPARSPSPIPTPLAPSGGRPPSTLGQGPVNFGSLSGTDASEPSMRPHMQQGPANLQQQPAHLRRESSQSTHSNMSANMNNNFVPNSNNRNRPFNQSYPGQVVPHSPNVFRAGPANMGQRTPSNVPQFPNQRAPVPNSPFMGTRSPQVPVAHMQQQQAQMQSGQPMSHPYGGQHYLQPQQASGMFVPQGYDPAAYNPYYAQQQQQFMHPGMNMQFPGAPPSPRPPFQNQYQSNPYQAPPHTQSMSRQSSHQGGPERPGSTPGHQLAPSTNTPVPSSGSPAPPATNFTARKSKAISIKDADGNVIDFKKTTSVTSPPPQSQSRGPVVVSSGAGVPSSSTPPPRPNAASPAHVRTDSQPPKSKEEITREFKEKIMKQAHADDIESVEQKAAKEKEETERKAKTEEVERVRKEEELRKIKEEESAKAALEKEAAENAKLEEAAAIEASDSDDEARLKQEEEEKWIAELEAQEAEEVAREEEYKRKKAEKEAKAIAEAAANEEEELRRLEREAEAREEAKLLKSKQEGEGDAEAKALFAQLKPNTQFGPTAASESGASTPASEAPVPVATPAPAIQAVLPKQAALGGKQKPAALKLETSKPIEPAQPTAGMQSLKSARFLQIKSESVAYPDGIKSPNPALNQGGKKVGQRYDKTFLLQFQDVFKEKPSIDWEKVVKETVGDSSDSARPQSARTPSMGNRQASRGPGIPTGIGVMGNFASNSRGTTSEQRFQASLGAQPIRPAPATGFGSFVGRPGAGFPMGAPSMVRSSSSQNMAQGGMNSPRNASQRGQGGRNSRRGAPSHQQEQQLAKTMPLTAGVDLKPLEISKSGWKPASIVAPVQAQVLPGTHMAPDMVQRKVKAALNKMTPEKFDKIANDILTIASQSRDESDGRTLRQVIQLTFEKACDEAHWASMYAKFCKRMLEEMGPEIKDENVRDKQGAVVVGGALFRKYLLNRCQEEFERGWEVNLPEKPEGQTEEVMLSDEYYIAAAAKRKGLGLIQFIGELYKLGMLTLRIMHECVIKLLQFEGLPDEAAVESLVKLLRTIGATMEPDPKGHNMIDTYFERIETVKAMPGLNSRLQFMLEDIIDLRAKRWRSKDDQKGPKTIQEIRQDVLLQQQAAEMERQRSSRGGSGRAPAGRGDARQFSNNMPPPDYPRNQVGMDDLKKLTRNARQTNTGAGGSLGPTSLLGSRSSSGRRGLGPMTRGDESAGSSRTGTPPVKDKESNTHVNAFSALAGLDASGDPTDDIASPPSTSPEVTKAQPAKGDESNEANGAVKGS